MGSLLRGTLFLAVALGAFAAQAQTSFSPLRLRSGLNNISNIAGDGRPGSISLTWRENGNAWGYDIYTVMVAGSVATHDDQTSFVDQPHTGEDSIVSVRFAKGRYQNRTTLFALVAKRDIVNSVPEPAKVEIKTYALVRNDAGLGTPYVFETVRKFSGSRLYCNAEMALKTELGLPLSGSYVGKKSQDGC